LATSCILLRSIAVQVSIIDINLLREEVTSSLLTELTRMYSLYHEPAKNADAAYYHGDSCEEDHSFVFADRVLMEVLSRPYEGRTNRAAQNVSYTPTRLDSSKYIEGKCSGIGIPFKVKESDYE
jgi:hypothetical protein